MLHQEDVTEKSITAARGTESVHPPYQPQPGLPEVLLRPLSGLPFTGRTGLSGLLKAGPAAVLVPLR